MPRAPVTCDYQRSFRPPEQARSPPRGISKLVMRVEKRCVDNAHCLADLNLPRLYRFVHGESTGPGEDEPRSSVRWIDMPHCGDGARVRLEGLTSLITSKTQRARVFVSAPYDTALRPLLDALRGAGVDAFISSDVASLGSDVVESARSAIEAADLVLVVLTKQPALNPIFEAGMAAALGKRLILVGAPGATLSMDLRSFVLVQASLEDPAPLSPQSRNWSAAPSPVAGHLRRPRDTPSTPTRSTAFCTMTGTSHSAQLRCSPMGASTGDMMTPSNRPLSTNVMNARSRSISKPPNISV